MGRALPRAAEAFFWSHPEWWWLAGSAGAWLLMLEHSLAFGRHAHHHFMTPLEEAAHFLLMIVAMMGPLLTEPLRITAFRSFPFRRHRAMIGFLAGYLVPWGCLAVPVAMLRQARWTHNHIVAAGAFALAAAWVLTPLRRRALIACHGTVPLMPLGWRADLSCAYYGLRLGRACATTCWALMLACTVTGHDVVAMISGAGVGLIEKWSRAQSRRSALLITLVAGYYMLLSLRS